MACDGCKYCVPNWDEDSNTPGCTRTDWINTSGDCFEQGEFVELSLKDYVAACKRIESFSERGEG
jgi:hypothetical protein